MKTLPKAGVTALFAFLLAGSARAANVVNDTYALTHSGPITTSIPLPDPTHISIVFGKDIKWKGGEGESPLFGDPNKPGIYGVLIKWLPGHNSKPHFHSTDRYIYVISGTWWVSASTTYDRSKMYPIPAGSFVTDIANTVHWDGAKKSTGPCLLMLVGEGPMHTTRLVQTDPKSPVFTLPGK
ncbi:MAG TPA: cupin domain-containing protein [Steroidobacteraceae bacterium]|nr:cupin domain-containing protein [Steroidobacteraceae bacterium]